MTSVEIITRWYRLRKLGLLMPLLHEPATYDRLGSTSVGERVFTFQPTNPHGTRQLMPWDVLESLVIEAEDSLRKPVQSVIITAKEKTA